MMLPSCGCVAVLRRWAPVLVLIPLVLTITDATAEACTCGMAEPSCTGVDERFTTERAVFVGTVLSVVPVFTDVNRGGRDDMIPDSYTIRVRIEEDFTKFGLAEVEVSTNGSTSACGFEFAPGQRYLVHAARSPTSAVLQVNRCSRTRALAYAADEVDLLRAAGAGSFSRRIFGTVWLGQRGGGVADDLPGLKVVASDGGREYETVTDARGQFRLRGLPTATYRVRAWSNESFSKEALLEATLSEAKPCAEVDFLFVPGARVSGTVVDEIGRPISGIQIVMQDLTPFGEREQGPDSFSTISYAGGRFEIQGLPPGRYAFGIIDVARAGAAYLRVELATGPGTTTTPLLTLLPNQNVEEISLRVPTQ